MLSDKVKRYRMFAIYRDIAVTECSGDATEFFKYMRDTYGLCVEDYSGYLTPTPAIVHEQKYLLFKIKFGI